MKKCLLASLAVMPAIFLSSGPANATCKKCECSVSSPTLQFGNYAWTDGEVTVVGTIEVSCWRTSGGAMNDGTYSLHISAGASGNSADRTMTAPGPAALRYNVYTSSGMATVWTTVSGFTFSLPTNDATFSRTHNIYGRLPASQTSPAGNYIDPLTVTLTYNEL